MRNKRFRGALTALLCIPLTAAAVLSWTTLRPSASGALRTVAFASTFLAAPKSAVAAMGKVWQLEEGKATPEDPSGGFWTQLPEPPSPPLPPSAASRPEGAGAVVEATYTGKEDARTLFCGTGLVKNVTDLPRAEVERMLAAPLPFQLAANSKEPQILIMHTHATESYQSTKELWYDPAEQSRNTDTAANVVAVGEVLSKTLNDGGIVTLHDATLHDYPSYNGSYARSRATVERYLAEYPSIQVVLDIHRDAIEKEDGTRIRPVTSVGGARAAQMMIICGVDSGSMGMPNYPQNLRFAGALQNSLAALSPTLARPVLADYRNYNQQLTSGSLLIEVGGHANTLAEAQVSAGLLGKAILALTTP